ncbi:Myogenesis-regulating glycosidase [Holothuria leucospilota]|uniref:Myogenesis-regulating glycosidase n=1 Tax=Holothuria leucospilota TaxID=206669 RepID=A0A9Q1BN34_HOLLE|nr:Myogenesis-regulating glycosidase [Holothuria leucospilota]
MIGGNVYDEGFHSTKLPSRELFIRWLQLTAFLPSMQYSISPWQYDEDVVDIALRWTSFHENVITPILLRIIREEIVTEGKPLNRPVWWIAPEDPIALVIDSEFLVGDEMLVAPIVTEGALSRDVYLPEGAWYDHLHGETVQGGQWLYDVGVPLDETLYYTRQ